jgi:YHS domain-containing protein
MNKTLKGLALAFAILILPGCATTKEPTTAAQTAEVKPYTLKTCIVTDEDLDKDAYTFVYKGQEIKLCCEPCKEDFDKKPSKYLKKLARK